MPVEFYDVKTRQKVKINDKQVMKTTFTTKNGQTRYALRGKTSDGRMLTKFVSIADWNKGKYVLEPKSGGHSTSKPPAAKKSSSSSAYPPAAKKSSSSSSSRLPGQGTTSSLPTGPKPPKK
jgi:hypothetical protein